jgi:hypothetical protein
MAEIISVHTMADAEALRTMEYAPRIRLPRASRSSKQDSAFHRTIELAPHRVRICSLDHLRTSAAVLEIVDEKLAEGRGAWSFDNLAPLRLAVRLFERLRTVRYTILRALLRNPGDLDEHRRLRTHGDAIRHIGRHPSASSVVRLLAVKLGNRLKKVAAKMISGKRSAAWFEKRIASLIAHIRKVQTKRIPLI